jgi:isoleucyl-tRNA synthetase
MSAGIPLPTGVFSHGFVNADDGRKMSKSYNNAVDPHDVSRYFLTSKLYNKNLHKEINLNLISILARVYQYIFIYKYICIYIYTYIYVYVLIYSGKDRN